ncbi:transcription/translation regulatory transformer protein RfaH [Pseudomonas sp. R3.Fl]|uniref:transcription/translation regulatory transformer protein RfaH n=1 Tax=Pseudomonas sp. R3.Fl TaxID=2928708 RepID=UPI00201DF6DA|nr:transcription/translation regulatory transformer protein RfaH [Pseudomonas sp. R3.Fl]MCL6688664.1 transcription/translation regulatory transformer protein RfaH [Pseudomonas sp. R3.Fl]
MPDATGKRWYLIQCKPRQDRRALEHLERQGYQCLLPLHSVERLQKGKLQQTEEPLFPGYLFIHLDKVDDNWLPIRSTRGINQIVSFGDRPTPVPDQVIGKLFNAPTALLPALVKGDQVLIDDANLNQLEAIFLCRNGNERVLILLNILQREVTISLPIERLRRKES